jgi:hypothetical protein
MALGFRQNMKKTAGDMLETLEQVRLLVAQSPSSPWATQAPGVLAETLEREIACLRSRGRLRWFGKQRLKLLFAPTGDLQETSISGGWAEEFLALSFRFDDALEKL